MNCPLCDYKGLADDALNCPSCNADLSAYRSLDDVEKAMEKQKKRTLLFIILFLIAFIGCFAIYIILTSGSEEAKKEETAETTQTEQPALEAENESLKTEIIQLKAEISRLGDELETAKENQLTTHVISEGETLFAIARYYYDDGGMYPKIAADNCIDDPDFILAGEELIIIK